MRRRPLKALDASFTAWRYVSCGTVGSTPCFFIASTICRDRWRRRPSRHEKAEEYKSEARDTSSSPHESQHYVLASDHHAQGRAYPIDKPRRRRAVRGVTSFLRYG